VSRYSSKSDVEKDYNSCSPPPVTLESLFTFLEEKMNKMDVKMNEVVDKIDKINNDLSSGINVIADNIVGVKQDIINLDNKIQINEVKLNGRINEIENKNLEINEKVNDLKKDLDSSKVNLTELIKKESKVLSDETEVQLLKQNSLLEKEIVSLKKELKNIPLPFDLREYVPQILNDRTQGKTFSHFLYDIPTEFIDLLVEEVGNGRIKSNWKSFIANKFKGHGQLWWTMESDKFLTFDSFVEAFKEKYCGKEYQEYVLHKLNNDSFTPQYEGDYIEYITMYSN